MAHTSIEAPSARPETLNDLWRLQAQRMSRVTLTLCVVAGIIGLSLLLILGDYWIASLLLVVAGAFGVDGLAIRASSVRSAVMRRRFHQVGVLARAIAIGSALLIGLLSLQAIFGSRVEVMPW